MGQIVYAFHQYEAQEQYFLNSAGIRHCFIILTGTSNPSASNLLETLIKSFTLMFSLAFIFKGSIPMLK